MPLHNRPTFRRPAASPYAQGSFRSRLTGLPEKIGDLLINGAGWMLLLLFVAGGADGDLPTSKKGWLALLGIVITFAAIVVVAKRFG